MNQLKLKIKGRTTYIDPEKIIFLKAEGSYTRIVFETSDKEVLICKTLKRLLDNLPDNIFLRIHHSYLVNIEKITAFDCKRRLITCDNNLIPISRRYSCQVYKYLFRLNLPDLDLGEVPNDIDE
jgi:DNA-binding LytR/AlgR family response regulator